MSAPLVSVALPVRNGGLFLEAAVRSILAQDEGDLELRVYDNASDDETAEVLAGFSDPRLAVTRGREPLHIADSHNAAASGARGRYLALMGADDIARRDRLARQVAALEADPALGMLSSWARMIDERGRVLGTLRYPTEDGELRRKRLRYHGFILPALVLRRELFERLGGFDRRYAGAMDYDLSLRAMSLARVANVPDTLVDFRFHRATGSMRRFREQQLGSLGARLSALRRDGFGPEAVWLVKPILASCLPDPLARRMVRPYLLAAHGDRRGG